MKEQSSTPRRQDPPNVALRIYRARHGITQGELAASLGLTGTTIHRYEAAIKRPSVESAKAIEKLTGISWQDWFADDEKAA